jgi:hypothetical protein
VPKSIWTCFITIFCLSAAVYGQSAKQRPIKQQPVPRDPQAVSLLRECVRAGGGQSLGKIEDFRATGQITYASPGREDAGQVSIAGKGTHSFSLTTQMSEGSESWVVEHMKGQSKDIRGRVQTIPPHNSVNLGALNFPLLSLFEIYNSSTAGVVLVGKSTRYGHEVYQIRTQRDFQETAGTSGTLSMLSVRDFYIDVESLLPLGASWTSHPISDFNQGLTEEIVFSSFQQLEGVQVPFTVTDYLSGQKRWTLQIENIQFNQDVADSAFQQ